MAHKTGVILRFGLSGVALGTIIHLHPIPGISLIPRDISPPNINTVFREPVNLVSRQGIVRGKIPMAHLAFDFSHLYMGNMRKINAIWLPRVNQPRDLPARLDKGFKKLDLFRAISMEGFRIFMALLALAQSRNAGKGTILVEKVAFLTFQTDTGLRTVFHMTVV